MGSRSRSRRGGRRSKEQGDDAASGRSRRSRSRPKPQPDDEATTSAVLQSASNDDDAASVNSLQRIMRSSPIVAAAIRRVSLSGPSVDTVQEGSDEDGRARARIFDPRRICIIGVALAILVSVVVMSSHGFAEPPPSFSTSSSTPPHPTEDGLPHLHKYAYVFVAYDKFGYAVAHQFFEQLEKSMEEQDHHEHKAGGHLQEQFINPRSQFNAETKCTDLNFERSTVTILESPEFHCNMQKLRSLFMDHDDKRQEKWGVKVIHLVRNPFSIIVSNYYDRKGILMPEEVRFKNPCSSVTQNFTMTVADLNAPFLEENMIMTHKDFDDILARCNEWFQTQPGLEAASYQQHLEQLPPIDGLKLAVADGLNSIALMASDLVGFRKIHALVEEEALKPERKRLRHLDIMTVPLDEVLNYPGHSMIDFLDFIFGQSMSSSSKRKAAADYERNRIGEDYAADAEETGRLIGILKHDPMYGGPLTRVESLLESVLSEQAVGSEAEG
ncbi:hypothetical protein ACHAWF_007932 [Thalassiosira exigua]